MGCELISHTPSRTLPEHSSQHPYESTLYAFHPKRLAEFLLQREYYPIAVSYVTNTFDARGL